MVQTTVRDRFSLAAFAVESTPGTDAVGTVTASNYLACDFDFDYNPQVIANPELTGSLDASPSIPAGFRPTIRLKVPLRGFGGALGVPDWYALMQCCGMALTTTSGAVGAPTAAASGTTTTVTGTAPFVATANAYLGMPLSVTGTPVFDTGIVAYSAARVFDLGLTRTVPLSVSSLLQVPINNRWMPTSDETLYKTGTLYLFKDGYRWIFTGCVGTMSLELSTGGIGMMTFELRGQLASHTAAAVPTGVNTSVRPTPPKFVNGRLQLNRAVARASRVMFNLGLSVTLPPNPEALDGVDIAVPVARASNGSIDPLRDTTGAVALYDTFKLGTNMPLMAMIGSTTGNRFIITAPAARIVGLQHPDREGLMIDDIRFECDGPDAGLIVTAW